MLNTSAHWLSFPNPYGFTNTGSDPSPVPQAQPVKWAPSGPAAPQSSPSKVENTSPVYIRQFLSHMNHTLAAAFQFLGERGARCGQRPSKALWGQMLEIGLLCSQSL